MGFFFMFFTRIIDEAFFFVVFHDLIILGLLRLSLLLFFVFGFLLF